MILKLVGITADMLSDGRFQTAVLDILARSTSYNQLQLIAETQHFASGAEALSGPPFC